MWFIKNTLNALRKVKLRLREIFFKKILGNLGVGSPIYEGVNVSFPQHVFIGDGVSISPGVYLRASTYGEIHIGNRCAIAEGVRIITATHDTNVLPVNSIGINKSVVIGQDVWIGTAAIILPGVTIYDSAIVAAGAVVTKDVPPDCMVGGVPARVMRKLKPCKERLLNATK